MKKQHVTEEQITVFLRILNEALSADPEAISQLFHYRVPCNEALASHPTIQVRDEGNGNFSVSAFGVLNGLVGINEEQKGYLAIFQKGSNILNFGPLCEVPVNVPIVDRRPKVKIEASSDAPS